MTLLDVLVSLPFLRAREEKAKSKAGATGGLLSEILLSISAGEARIYLYHEMIIQITKVGGMRFY